MAKLDKYEVRARFEYLPGIPGNFLEMVMDLMDEDIGGDYEPGDLLRVSQGFKAVGSHLEAQAKESVRPRIQGGRGDSASVLSGDVRFTWKPGGTNTILDQAAVKKGYPQEDFPGLYKESNRRDSIEAK